ncbi:hypothetical protein H5410_062551 [Solanum commersonii]|uniref:Uncharacterized protein n=1 Tax=Solanum commersonii TaxID=4109 RepID=A0A9J5WAZ4_SOLCO|nr:hypothetical protein H5410_062551 [Solanum commersonii]
MEDEIASNSKIRLWYPSPMVIIMNTTLKKDDNDKWIGWEIRSCMTFSVLILLSRIFDIQKDHDAIMALEYWFLRPLLWDICRLYFLLCSFLKKGIDRDMCDYYHIHFYPGVKRKFYGYMEEVRDMKNFKSIHMRN